MWAARVRDPSAEELAAAIEAGFCWWCGATHTIRGGPEITGWSMHWSKAHGILVAQVRDLLGVTKDVVFVSEETRAKMRANFLKHDWEQYEAARRRGLELRKGCKNTVSKAGRLKLSESSRLHSKRRWRERREEMLAATHRGIAKRMAKISRLKCIICGELTLAPETAALRAVRKTCSERCSIILHARQYRLSDEEVSEIRRRVAAGGETHAEIAADFDCSRRRVGQLASRKRRIRVGMIPAPKPEEEVT